MNISSLFNQHSIYIQPITVFVGDQPHWGAKIGSNSGIYSHFRCSLTNKSLKHFCASMTPLTSHPKQTYVMTMGNGKFQLQHHLSESASNFRVEYMTSLKGLSLYEKNFLELALCLILSNKIQDIVENDEELRLILENYVKLILPEYANFSEKVTPDTRFKILMAIGGGTYRPHLVDINKLLSIDNNAHEFREELLQESLGVELLRGLNSELEDPYLTSKSLRTVTNAHNYLCIHKGFEYNTSNYSNHNDNDGDLL